MPYTGSAAAVIYQNLYTYLQGNLAVADFDFELDSAQGPPQLQANLHKIATELNSGSLERYCFYFYFLHEACLMQGDIVSKQGGSL